MSGYCLDTGALIAYERRDPALQARLELARSADLPLDVPAGALAQAWRGGSRQAGLARLLNSTDITVAELGEATARAVGELCAATGTADVVDAHVALHATVRDQTVLTSDPDDLRAINPRLRIVAV